MRTESVDVLVVGAGPAGLAAAAVAAGENLRVLAIDEAPVPGGRLPIQLHEDADGHWRPGAAEAEVLTQAARAAGARVVAGASVWGLFPGWDAYLNPVDPADPAAAPDRVTAPTVIVATGAMQNAVALPGWTLPGVLCVGAVQALLHVHRLRPGRRAVVVGVDPLALAVAHHLRLAGVEVRAVLPPAPGPFTLGDAAPAELVGRLARFAERAPGAGLRLAGQLVAKLGAASVAARLYPREGFSVWGVPLLLRRAVTAILGEEAVAGVRVADVDPEGGVVGSSVEDWPVDLVVTSGGLSPLVELLDVAGVRLAHVPELGGHVPLHGPDLETQTAGLFLAGSVTGVAAWPVAVAQGRLAGIAACRHLGRLTGPAAEARLVAARAELAEARRRTPAILTDEERGLARLRALWAAT